MKASLSFERRPYDPGERLNREFAHYLHYGEFMAIPHTDKGECYCTDCVDARDRARAEGVWVKLSPLHKDSEGNPMVLIGGALYPLDDARLIAEELSQLIDNWDNA